MMKPIKTLVFTGILIAVQIVSAQNPTDELANYKEKYPGQSAIFLKHNQEVTIKVKGEDILISSTFDEQLLFTDDNASQFSKKNIYFSSFFEIKNVNAFIEVPQGTKYKKAVVKDFKIIDDRGDGHIFHDDVQKINFYYPGLGAGAKTTLKYTQEYKEPRFFGRFRFALGLPLDEAEFVVHVPDNVELGYVMFGENTESVHFEKKHFKGGNTYTWRVKDVDALKSESSTPNYRYYAPHLQVFVKSYKTASGKEVVLQKDVAGLHDWYTSIIKDVDNTISEDIKAICDSITSTVADEEERVKSVFYWVQDNIKYIAFEAGLEGFVPRKAADICEKRYGDCKDMGNLITVMLKYMGINAHFTWIGSRDIPYSYDKLPTTASDNHAIATYIRPNGDPVFLDATSRLLPYGMPSGFIQGKQALVNDINGKPFDLLAVPVIPSEANLYRDSSYLKIQDKEIGGVFNAMLTGYFQKRFNESFVDEDKDRLKKSMKSYLSRGNNTFSLNDFEISNLGKRDEKLEINGTYTIKSYVVTSGDEMYVNLNLDRFLENDELKEDRQFPLEHQFKARYNYKVVLEVPAGYEVQYVPENTAYKHALFSYSINYNVQGNSVVYEMEHDADFLLLEKEHFNSWNEMIKSIRKAYNETISLKQK